MSKLHAYQQNLIDRIKETLKKTNKIVTVSPTRSGKTIMFSDILKKNSDAKKKKIKRSCLCLIVCWN